MQSFQLMQAAADLALVAAIILPPCATMLVIAALAENTATGRRVAAWAVQTIVKVGR